MNSKKIAILFFITVVAVVWCAIAVFTSEFVTITGEQTVKHNVNITARKTTSGKAPRKQAIHKLRWSVAAALGFATSDKTFLDNNDDDTITTTSQNITEEWLEACVEDLSLQDWSHKPFHIPYKYWGYRLGDCVKLCYQDACHSGHVFWGRGGPIGMARRYDELACPLDHPNFEAGGNLTILKNVMNQVRESEPDRFVAPDPDAVVIHLRLGDVLENNPQPVHKLLSQGGDPVHPGAFRNAIKSVYEYMENIRQSNATKVEIVGGSHNRRQFARSRLYAGCLWRALRRSSPPGVDVTLHIDSGDPDADFYYLSHAKKVVVSAGGYSRLIGSMVEFLGGTIIGRSFDEMGEIKNALKDALQKEEMQDPEEGS